MAIVLYVDYLERRRPGRAVDRRWEFGLNLLSLAVVVLAGEGWKEVLMKGFSALDTERLFSWTGLYELPGPARVILAIILADFCLYWIHRGMHWKGFLWRTHVFHHSIEHLWWLSGSRTSVIHLLLFAVPQILISYYLFQMTPWEAGAAFSFGVAVNIWIHSNLWVDLGRLEWLIITPNYHRVHHGPRELLRKNLGFVLTIWDRMFGTFADPHSVGRDFALGFVPTKGRLLRMLAGL